MLKKFKKAWLAIALPVPDGITKDNIVLLGDDGLKGYVHTSRATTATIAAGTAAQGLKNGEASVELIGVSLIAEWTLATAIAQFEKVFITPAGAYTATVHADNKFVGYALETKAAPGKCLVAITNA